MSDWVTYGADPNSTDFTATYTLGQAAADLATQLVHENYLWGGKGFDLGSRIFVDKNTLVTNYSYWNPDKGVKGAVDVGKGADGQYRNNVTLVPTSAAAIQPRDVFFFDKYTYHPDTKTWTLGADGIIDHVAMYVGDHGNYDVIEARSKDEGIATTSVQEVESRPSFVSLGRVQRLR